GVGKSRDGPVMIDGGLGPLGLQLIEDTGQLGDLALVQVELVDKEAQGSADAQATATKAAVPFLGRAFGRASFRAAARPATVIATFRVCMSGAPPGPKGSMHDRSPSRGAIRTQRGFCAWATYRTLYLLL